MHPAADHLVPGDRVGLGPLVFVVREPEVDPAGVHVDVLAQVVQGHRGALGVPAREPGAPRCGPGQLAPGGRSLPQCPVGMEPLLRIHLAAGPVAGPQVGEPVPGQLAVAGVGAGVEVHRAARRRVGVPAVQQPGDQPDHELDGLRRPRQVLRGVDVQRGAVGAEPRLVVPRDPQRALPLRACLGDDLVLAGRVDLRAVRQVARIGDVLATDHVQPARRRGPPDQVGQQVRAQVAHVGVPVDRGAAAVHPQRAPRYRLDRLDLPGPRVIEPKHSPTL